MGPLWLVAGGYCARQQCVNDIASTVSVRCCSLARTGNGSLRMYVLILMPQPRLTGEEGALSLKTLQFEFAK